MELIIIGSNLGVSCRLVNKSTIKVPDQQAVSVRVEVPLKSFYNCINGRGTILRVTSQWIVRIILKL